MTSGTSNLSTAPEVASRVRELVREASIEIGSHELEGFAQAREHLQPGQRIYVSHLPRQTWERTLEVCGVIAAAGFDPIPHVPVRLLSGESQLAELLRAAWQVGVREPLLISGDYATPSGDFSEVLQALRTGVLESVGFTRVSFAGHPEGHPAVAPRTIHQAQVEKARFAAALGLHATFVTQFFFSAKPFVQWACALRSEGIHARLVAGLAGPAKLGQLLRLATRCGVGPSLRALSRRPASMRRLLREHAPDDLLAELAGEWQRCAGLFDGAHFFSFGGFAQTVDWLRRNGD